MNCTWYEGQLEHSQMDLWQHGRPSAELLRHAQTCDVCRRLIDQELALREPLIELANSSRHAVPSDSVQHNLLAAVRSRAPQPKKTIWKWGLAIATAACLVIAVLLTLARHSKPQPTVATVSPKPTPQPTVTAPIVASAAEKPIIKTTKRSAAPSKPVAARANRDFYPVVMCDSLSCAGPTVAVRVELPASPLVIRGGSPRTVMADLLVGEDGLVRGVRLLQ